MPTPFFIIGCRRSGTTALAKALQSAGNIDLHIELEPKLQIESADRLNGLIQDGTDLLYNTRNSYMDQAEKQGKIFGDKNPCYMPFLDELQNMWNCKILFLVRDGREVVRSIMDWHNLNAPGIYVREEDGEPPGHPYADNPWSYNLMRPGTDDPYYKSWKTLSRFEKCAWFWSRFNEETISRLEKWPKNRWMMVNMNDLNNKALLEIQDFIGAEGMNLEHMQELLKSRINSVNDRFGEEDDFPHWKNWSPKQITSFDDIADPMMKILGYK